MKKKIWMFATTSLKKHALSRTKFSICLQKRFEFEHQNFQKANKNRMEGISVEEANERVQHPHLNHVSLAS